MRRAVFIDRDGVIVRNVKREGFAVPTAPFLFSEFSFFPNVSEALRLLRSHGFLCILVTNQPDVAYGHITRDEWEKIHDEVRKLPLDDVFVCMHTRCDNCECKKPKPGMLFAAQRKWNIDLARSFMVGDTDNDTIAGSAAGCATILVDAEYNREVKSDFRAADFLEAARLVISQND